MWRHIVTFCESEGADHFTEDLGMRFLDKRYNFSELEKAGKLTQSIINVFRIIRMIGDFQQHGSILAGWCCCINPCSMPGNDFRPDSSQFQVMDRVHQVPEIPSTPIQFPVNQGVTFRRAFKEASKPGRASSLSEALTSCI